MRKHIAVVALVITTMLVAVGTPGCASWWQHFKSDPVAQVQLFESSVQTAMSVADVVWNGVKVLLPPDIVAQVQPRYDQAVLAVNKALAALNDAVQVAVEAQNPNPDFSKLIADVEDAVLQVQAIINDFRTPPTGSKEPTVFGKAELEQSIQVMKRVGGVRH